MAKISVKGLVIKKRGAKVYCYWQPNAAERQAGWAPLRLGNDIRAAQAACDARNTEVEQWRDGGARPSSVKAFVQRGTMQDLIDAYELRGMPKHPNTQREYRTKLKIIARWAGSEFVEHITRARVRKLRDALLKPDAEGYVATHRAAGTMRMLHALMQFALNEGFLPEGTPNPAAKQNMPAPAARDQIWSEAAMEIVVALAKADEQPGLALILLLAREAAQREADFLHCTIDKWVVIPRHKLNPEDWERLAEPNAQGIRDVRGLRVRQRKTRRWIEVPIVGETREMVEQACTTAREANTTLLLLERRHKRVKEEALIPWTPHQFQRAIADLRSRAEAIARERDDGELAAEIADLQFRDLRRTCVVWLGELGVEDQLIAAITGHSLDATRKILEVYMPRTTKMAGRAIALRIERTVPPNVASAIDAGSTSR